MKQKIKLVRGPMPGNRIIQQPIYAEDEQPRRQSINNPDEARKEYKKFKLGY